MDLKNDSKNQHFLSQAEQRLNALNPAAKERNQRIYEFDLIDRERYFLKLKSDRGVVIGNTLSLHDLFSFDVLGSSFERYNFEKLFQGYESQNRILTQDLLRKVGTQGADIGKEVVNLFLVKFLNFLRNPYSVKKILNTFPPLLSICPTDPIHLDNFNRVLKGRKPHQRHLCAKLDISEDEYIVWLSVIFLLLTPLGKADEDFLSEMVKGLFES
ncbi:hypothetical protein [Pseudomonas sp. H3(2019)]|uniref:hypothetical protein n=1 Tax=Pseudomonas sp. H3(2019) TaxID=2598724 RepID=UPI001C49C0D4|nr:hypothetical protein [Pseudomonas sp. H3(2019)]